MFKLPMRTSVCIVTVCLRIGNGSLGIISSININDFSRVLLSFNSCKFGFPYKLLINYWFPGSTAIHDGLVWISSLRIDDSIKS